MKTHPQANPTELHSTIKLGIDAHSKWLALDGFVFQPRRTATAHAAGAYGFCAAAGSPCSRSKA